MNRLMAAAIAVLAAAGMPGTVPGIALGRDANAETTPLGAGMTGETTLDGTAGKIEARLLSGLVVKQAAAKIVDAIGTDYSTLTMVVLPLPEQAADASTNIGGKGWDVLKAEDALPPVEDMARVRDSLTSFNQRYTAIAAQGSRTCGSQVQMESIDKGITESLGSITGVLNAATPILNLFKQDFTYKNIDVRIRDGMLVTAVRGEIAARRKPQAATTTGGAQTFGEAVAAMDAQLKALPKKARCDDDGGAEANRAALATAFEDFRGALSGPASVPDKTLIAAAEDQLRRLGPKPATLVLAIDADGASLIKRGNLFTMFGAETTTISTGIVVSYEFYEPQSGGVRALKSAGVLSCMSGAVGIRKIHSAKDFQSRAGCF